MKIQLLVGPETASPTNQWDIIICLTYQFDLIEQPALNAACAKLKLHGNPEQPMELWYHRMNQSAVCIGVFPRKRIPVIIAHRQVAGYNSIRQFSFRELHSNELIVCLTGCKPIGNNINGKCSTFYNRARYKHMARNNFGSNWPLTYVYSCKGACTVLW